MIRDYFYNQFKDDKDLVAGYRMKKGSKYITIEYLTIEEGHYDKTYRIPIADFKDVETTIDQINCGNILPIRKRLVR